ncbi:hypothetical protein ACWT_3578 [Actinoplanes sp. SE50]|uniref:hypothetical protein n=1 Tax=unclassified Actinoplanes TaxID=2626549 RepID=UPI00023EC299|nr:MULTISPECIES: hypothetical protein [unclassified Actinoplanes]AEV84601.1 hypothetical protein ACPL_3706 [Actinoplanes sp. SE50/110]ATO82993.1 hypothetical protein ACWT_3578 [Actinoplanes sp. SE50]SLM00401.1 hypothetical protein ACSP50_3633 [Actinoplanes sp. SE50/110]
MATQNLTCTLLPRGAGRHGGLRFDVHVAPQLTGDGADVTLGGQFPDFTDWPAAATRLGVSLRLDDGGTTTVVPGRRLSAPDSRVWTAMFTPRTPVRTPRVTEALDDVRVASYPIRQVVQFLSRQWGEVGVSAGRELPCLADFDRSPLRALGFQDGGLGQRRLNQLREDLRTRYQRGGGAVRADRGGLDDDQVVGMAFLQAGEFHSGTLTARRNPPPRLARRAAPAPAGHDFHDAVALAASHGPLQRLLGLVLEFETEPSPVLTALLTGASRTDLRFTLALGTDALRTTTTLRVPTVVCLAGAGRFEPAPRGAGVGAGLIRFAADTYSVTCLDADAGAQAVNQFAATLTGASDRDLAARDRREALPALRTGPMTVAKDDRAGELVDRLRDRRTEADPVLFAEDLVRGLRWDVRDGDGPWRSLMCREGFYEFHRLPGKGTVTVYDEAAVVTATTRGKDADHHDVPGDHLITESMMSWSGWSLAVEPLTRPVGTDNRVRDAAGDIDPAYQFGTRFRVPPGSLPRLRFGHSYRFRARTVDLGNAGVAATEDDLGEPDMVTPAATFLRYDPVEAPTVVPRQPPGPAEGPRYAVVHESRPVSSRHVVPPRTAQTMLEWHGELDRGRAGTPDPRAWQTLRARDDADLADLRAEDADCYPQELLDPPYLVDALAQAALVRGLPGRTTETVVDLDGSFRVDLRPVPPGGAGWRGRGRILEVGLEPGDIYRLRISSRFDPDDLAVMGVWDLMRTSAVGTDADVDTLRRDACEGRLWPLTPARDLMLVHAVRTPLPAPRWLTLKADRLFGEAPATITATMEISQKSTATLDVRGAWRMPVDDGPGFDTDPGIARDFRSTAYSVKVTHPEGAAPDTVQLPVGGTHHFTDHRYRRVSYTAVATSPFVEHFREETTVRLSTAAPARLSGDTEPFTVRVRDALTGAVFAPAPSGVTDPARAAGDFLVDPDRRLLHRTAGGRIAEGAKVVVSLVRGPLTRESAPIEVDVLSSVPRAPPRIHSVVPTFAWDDSVPGTSRRLGGGLRVYLERPWWSWGDGELLGVVLHAYPEVEPQGGFGGTRTDWAADPVTTAPRTVAGPMLSSFPLAVKTAEMLPVEGGSAHVAGHKVAFDPARDLWYADIRITDHDDEELSANLPFVRLALARYQPNALPDCLLSPVVAADFSQLVNGRTATVTRQGSDYVVTVTGHAGKADDRDLTHLCAFAEGRTAIADPELTWRALGSPVELSPIAAGAGQAWTGRVPRPGEAHRIVVQEYELHPTDNGTVRRVVYTDILTPR